MKGPLLFACLTIVTGPVHAGSTSDEFSTRAEILNDYYAVGTRRDSPFQRIAAQPDHTWHDEVRADLAWDHDALGATLRPRLGVTSQAGETHVDNWLNEGWLRWRATSGVSLQGGREALLWGPSMFWNPSNPFFTENNKSNPKREIVGKDLLRARWQATPSTALSAISQTGRGHRDSGTQRMDGIKLDWVGKAASAAAILAAEPGKAPGWQGWAQWTATDALLLYGELAWRDGNIYAVPVAAASPTGWRVASTPTQRALLAVAGASYTFTNDWTLHTEYWHNGAGLSDTDAGRIAAATASLGRNASALASQQLGSLLPEPAPLRRNYLGLQLGSGESASVGWKLRLTRNLDDDSMEGVLMLDRDLGDHLKLWCNLMQRSGNGASEYGRWARSSTMAGLTWFAW